MTDEIPPRGRRRRKEARPSEILEAGLEEFAEKGFAATRLEDVARRAGISKGTIYLYFDSKEALFEAALLEHIVPVIAGVEGDLGADRTTEELLSAVLGQMYDRIASSDAVMLKVLLSEGHRSPALVKFHYENVVARGLTLLEAIVARGIARGEVRNGLAAREPRIIFAPAIMAAVWMVLFEAHDPLDRERFVAAHLDLLRNGLLGADGPRADR